MSQLPSQIAMANTSQAARRNAPVDVRVGIGIPSVQPASIQAPGIPSVAPMPVPVPDMSAARDLEQALRATQALGHTLVDVGNATNIQRQIDERRSLYQARLQANKDEGQMLVDFQAGKMDNTIDATDDMDAFVRSYAERYYDPSRQAPPQAGESLTPAEVDYRERIGRTAQQLYIKRRAERQKQEFKDDALGALAGLIDPTTVGPNQDADTMYSEFARRYQWLDKQTFMEAVYGKALEALAKSGDKAGFDTVSNGIMDQNDRTIYVEPLRNTLNGAISSQMAAQMQAANIALKAASESTDPFVSRYSKLSDALNTLVKDDGAKEQVLVDFFANEVANTRSLGDMEAADFMALLTLSEMGFAEYNSRRAALQRPVMTKVLKAAADDPNTSGSDFADLAQSAEGVIDPVDLQNAYETRVKNVREYRKQLLVTEYAKTGDRAKVVGLLDSGLKAWDSAIPDWRQIDGAIDGPEYLNLMDEIAKVDRQRQTVVLAGDVMAGRVALQPGDQQWDAIMASGNVMRGGRIVNPNAAAALVASTNTVPSKMLDALYADLRGSKEDVQRGVQLLASLAPVLSDPEALSKINGFNMSQADAGANASTILAIQSVVPVLANMTRLPDGSLADKDVQAAAEMFRAAQERWQEAQPPLFDKKRFEDLLRGSGIDKVDGITAVDPQTNSVTVTSFQNALKTAAANKLSKAGLDPNAATELADIASSIVLRESVPAIGNAGMSKDVTERRMNDAVALVASNFHLPKLGGRGFPSPVDRALAPNAEWNEQAAIERLAQDKIDPANVVHIFPSAGEENRWWMIVRQEQVDKRTRKRVETTRFIQLDLPMLPVNSAEIQEGVTIEQRIEMARKRFLNDKNDIKNAPALDIRTTIGRVGRDL